ncbi:saccharopine dehydrogenase NADP-binding domain-containing protein [Microbulbifer sp. CAU 1566]|uniref:saccharopine dehydrogenase NADP-binding domain-containing protein n=1 Tax=Microbulbifer sp. CAU 1566 TaxID=2933269 RepID=UPI002002BDEC|nr:saccharopine dehydrogenase NADP-binding domain-containing protein [Microbulbifer sp. CAU 1566]MCK7597387.1 saccharopine dehydrogenase NADP-binding domain-containing protein [Microbulbifer sp. CAU 1566]
MSPLKTLHKRVLILGGYGEFGSRVAEMLATEPDIQILIGGHDRFKAELLANRLQQQYPDANIEGLRLEHDSINLAAQLRGLNLLLLIHCAGPFKAQSFHVANACIENGIHYLDIADSADLVCGIRELDAAARAANCSVISGASTLPALSSAVIAALSPSFSKIHSIEISIAPAHRIRRGLATVRSGLESLGQKFGTPRNGAPMSTYVGDELRKVEIGHPVGPRWVCNFEVPDLHLIPELLPQVQDLRFGTGVQPAPLQFGLALCARLARLDLPAYFPAPRPLMARIGHWLAAHWPGGSDHGGIQLDITGFKTEESEATGERAKTQGAYRLRWEILGLNGDGPWIPAAPAAAMARKIVRGHYRAPGARPCWTLIDLEDILEELAPRAVVSSVSGIE